MNPSVSQFMSSIVPLESDFDIKGSKPIFSEVSKHEKRLFSCLHLFINSASLFGRRF